MQKTYLNSTLSSKILFNELMSKHNTFGIGGEVNCFIYPKNKNELSKLLKYIQKEKIQLCIIGSGSNILVWDEGFHGIIISLNKTFKKLKITNELKIIAESGVMLGTMVKNAIHNNIIGLESLIGVPGTLGGALIMNAGAYGSEISNYFLEAKTMTLNGEIKKYKKENITFSYRHSNFPKNEILIEATFQCIKGDKQKIQEDRIKASQNRKLNQPLKFRSAGSIFKNPSNKLAAGYLIDQAGLKGKTKGGACISSKHANFIINLGNATAKDVFYLIILAKKTVAKKFNVKLELEIKLIGFPKTILSKIYD